MTNSLNQIASEYVGLIALAGIVGSILTILFGVLAVYFYYNPKRQKYKIRYKIFAHGFTSALVYLKGLGAETSDDEYVFNSYIDVWNGGQESIGLDVVRGPLQIYLDPSVTGTEIRSVEISTVLASEVANFRAKSADGKVEVSWDHFDPGEAIRLRVATNRPLRNRDFGLLGKGLRLSIGKSATDEGGWLREALVPILIGAIVLLVGSAATYAALKVASSVDRDSIWVLIFGFPVLAFALIGVIGLPMGAGFLMSQALEAVFNNKSPVERAGGAPSVGVPSVISKKLYLDFLSSLEPEELEALIHRHRIDTSEREVGFGSRSAFFARESKLAALRNSEDPA